jgi:resuscitation-promoting factor RpfB
MKHRSTILLLLCASLICIVSLRPDDAVEATRGRASVATVTALAETEAVIFEKTALLEARAHRQRDVIVWKKTIQENELKRIAAQRAQRKRVSSPPVNMGNVWDRLAQCESGGNWAINTGNGYYGGLQFSLSSWRAVGGTGYPHEHSRETQIAMGERLRASGGWGHWPACSRKLGLR